MKAIINLRSSPGAFDRFDVIAKKDCKTKFFGFSGRSSSNWEQNLICPYIHVHIASMSLKSGNEGRS